MSVKRAAGSIAEGPGPGKDDECDNTDRKKQKTQSSSPPPSNYWLERVAAFEEEYDTIPPLDERQDITDELEAGSHRLILEYNQVTTAKCRALKCLVEDLRRQHNERIRSPYRLNLQNIQPSGEHWTQLEKPNQRFFHVSCFEAIGVNIAKYVTLPPERSVHGYTSRGFVASYTRFHPAIVDWVTNGGKAFNADLYEDYQNALEVHNEKFERSLIIHSLNCEEDNCICGLPLSKPKSADFISGEPSERSLTDVLLEVLGASHLFPLKELHRILLLEVHGKVPEPLFKAVIAAAEQNEDENDDDCSDETSGDATEKTAEETAAEPQDHGEHLEEDGIGSSRGSSNAHSKTSSEAL